MWHAEWYSWGLSNKTLHVDLLAYVQSYSIFFYGYYYERVKLCLQKYCICTENCGYISTAYVACGKVFVKAFQWDITCVIILSTCKVIRYSLKGTQKVHLHKYCICAANRGYISSAYTAYGRVLIKGFKRCTICRISISIYIVIVYSLKGIIFEV